MAKAYLIAHIRVQDAKTFEGFKSASGAALQKHGGRPLVRNPDPEMREGDLGRMTVVVEFDSMDAARAFYESPEYTEARKLRETCSETDLILVEGL
ncbi:MULTISPECIES: DUF1330 domain-containing protein [unclassified Sulfitobacter]|jgi:uncharacterized protein (DUF1330 family)|uniref:DUF1330 domain-containing protein n=1 Tax=unclassified Sulfitobacter TaxID=196795 RepID=UPI0007C3405B|nr:MULTISPECIES: DUF1330 domain-containing protein [unclassified Sulfitobacter]KZY06425.1 hypothetical protein A3721_11770 [Sulfitobacter sp. HI0023]KZY23470.1 hypothetical protein A3728_08690 [Sulfitobacter sp. HI0040]KZZ66908.1 hypothetical protein A3764_15935 [Sulfitobacter sp. HI0129]